MFYFLFEYLELEYQIPGASLFKYLSFRSALAFVFSLMLSVKYGKNIINFLKKKQIGETVRDLGLDGQKEKEGTPTMGGLIIIIATIVPVILFSKFNNIYIIILLFTTLWLGLIGFLDDYIKVFKKNKEGLAGRFKIVGQVGIGLIVGFTVYFHPDIKTRVEIPVEVVAQVDTSLVSVMVNDDGKTTYLLDRKSPNTTIPFVKNNEFNYSSVLGLISDDLRSYTWIIYVLAVIFIITAVSNGANLTDGIDGLATGTSAIIMLTIGVFVYLSGNVMFSDYLDIMYIPNIGELTVFVAAFIGACIGFLWYNSYPAQIFMGDTGSLAIGGIIATLAILVRKELLIPVLCGIFFIETISVMMQVGYFKYTKKKLGEGKRIFLMAPLHHHYQKKGLHESKIVSRFWIVGIMLAIITVVTLKLR
jgi:phospho-N-acetylmuramoyl-pentapeptide-transferase